MDTLNYPQWSSVVPLQPLLATLLTLFLAEHLIIYLTPRQKVQTQTKNEHLSFMNVVIVTVERRQQETHITIQCLYDGRAHSHTSGIAGLCGGSTNPCVMKDHNLYSQEQI